MKTKIRSAIARYSERTIAVLLSATICVPLAQAQEESDAIDEVVVIGIRGSLRDALNEKRNSDTFVDAIIAEDIGKLPDDNLAETLQRVAGVQLEREAGEGVNITIRGIRENRTEVNGRTLISAYGRGTNAGLFNYFPSEIVGKVQVTKLLTADMTDGALGGTVNIVTRKPLDYDGFWGGASVKGTYTDLNSDNGTRASAIISNTFNNDTMGFLIGATFEDRPITQDRFYSNGDWRSDTRYPSTWTLPNAADENIYYMYDLRYQRKTETREKAAANMAFQWRPSDSLDINADVLYAEYDYDRSRGWFSAQMDHPRGNDVFNPVITAENHLVAGDVITSNTLTDHEGFQEPQDFITGGINANWTLENGLNVNLDLAHTETNRVGDQQYLQMLQTGIDFSFDLLAGGDVPQIDASIIDLDPLNYTVRTMFDHRSINEASEDSIKLDLEYELDGFFTNIRGGIRHSDISTLTTFVAKRGVSIDPRNGNSVNWDTAEATSMLRAGVGYLTPDNLPWAEAALRPFDLSGVLPGTGVDLPSQIIVLDTHLVGNGAFGFSDAFYDAPFESFPERTSKVEDVVSAAYVRADFEVNGWEGNVGIRYARTSTAIDNFALEGGVYVPFYKKGSYSDVLPSLVVKKDLRDDLVFRFGYGETITRAPTNILGAVARINLVIDDPLTPEDESENSTATLPNPDLEPQRGSNYDASLEWYFTDASALAFGLFYKSLDNQIDTGFKTTDTIDGFGDQQFLITTATNISGGWIKGLEIAYQQEFRFLPGVLANTGASINYTYLQSETDDIDPRDGKKLPIQGMSEHSINAQLYYEDERLSARLLYNWRDDYYDRVDPFSRGTAIWNKGQPSLDAALRYRISEQISAELQVVNITDSAKEEFAGFEQYINTYNLNGTRWSLGLSMNF